MKFLLSGGARFYRALTFFSFVGFFFLALTASAQTTNGLSDAEIKGQQLTQEILQQTPVTNFIEKGILRIRNSKGVTTNVPVTFETSVKTDYWEVFYYIPLESSRLVVVHENGKPNQYCLFKPIDESVRELMYVTPAPVPSLNETQIMAPFANSDFWIVDLGLEFFHWPEQKIIKHQERRTRECTVLESTNPDPSAGGYSRVDSWVDDETLGIVHAEAYDAKGKLLKVFDPKSFKKVNGQWELQDMEIRNVQTGSRTWIKFDLNNKS
jgi:hypothetical protein